MAAPRLLLLPRRPRRRGGRLTWTWRGERRPPPSSSGGRGGLSPRGRRRRRQGRDARSRGESGEKCETRLLRKNMTWEKIAQHVFLQYFTNLLYGIYKMRQKCTLRVHTQKTQKLILFKQSSHLNSPPARTLFFSATIACDPS